MERDTQLNPQSDDGILERFLIHLIGIAETLMHLEQPQPAAAEVRLVSVPKRVFGLTAERGVTNPELALSCHELA